MCFQCFTPLLRLVPNNSRSRLSACCFIENTMDRISVPDNTLRVTLSFRPRKVSHWDTKKALRHVSNQKCIDRRQKILYIIKTDILYLTEAAVWRWSIWLWPTFTHRYKNFPTQLQIMRSGSKTTLYKAYRGLHESSTWKCRAIKKTQGRTYNRRKTWVDFVAQTVGIEPPGPNGCLA